MNKKMIVSIFALGAIVAGSANAAITKEQCQKSEKTIWVENIQNSDGTRGACVPKNACESDAFRSKFCNTSFKNIQVASEDSAKSLIALYATNILKYQNGCGSFIDVSVNNSVGQDYIGCYTNGNYMTFEFDDTNETNKKLAYDDYRRGICIAYDGNPSINGKGQIVCNGISKANCDKIGSSEEYTAGDSSCIMGDREKLSGLMRGIANFYTFGIAELVW